MRTNNGVGTAIVFLAAMAFGTSANGQEINGEHSLGAFAMFQSTDASGCINTTVFLTGGESFLQNPPGPPTLIRATSVAVSSFDSCNVAFDFLFGSAPTADLMMSPGLTSARLVGTVPACDFLGECVDLVIDVEWTPTTDPFRAFSILHQFQPDAQVVSRQDGKSRNASAAGTVLLNGITNLTPEPAVGASLSSSQNRSLQKN